MTNDMRPGEGTERVERAKRTEGAGVEGIEGSHRREQSAATGPDATGPIGLAEPAGTPAAGAGTHGTGTPGTGTHGTGTQGTGRPVPSREGGLTGGAAAGAMPGGAKHAARDGASAHETPLLPHEECDKLAHQMHHAVGEFVDEPRHAVEEADHVLEEAASRFTEAVTQRRRTLRRAWQSTGDGAPAETDTEQLRLALRDYRELTERLLKT
ncbi:hypothetical protein ACFS5L_31730 [Streptomyces phyllanthi]|uniref:hypothetical protein n=1 Tax=Streptomyces phyllanthi TaxID=1803180 RepID=UPI001D13D3E9|nr:hypothetical protein [Streptomyces phyllanthi]